MRPRTKRLAPDVWIVREQASYEIFEAAPFWEHPNLVLRSLPFRRSPIRFAASFHSL